MSSYLRASAARRPSPARSWRAEVLVINADDTSKQSLAAYCQHRHRTHDTAEWCARELAIRIGHPIEPPA